MIKLTSLEPLQVQKEYACPLRFTFKLKFKNKFKVQVKPNILSLQLQEPQFAEKHIFVSGKIEEKNGVKRC